MHGASPRMALAQHLALRQVLKVQCVEALDEFLQQVRLPHMVATALRSLHSLGSP
jgi:hypothetical protein